LSRDASGFYRRKDGTERLWLSDPEIETTTDQALRNAGLFPNEQQMVVDIERFIQELGVRMDQHARLQSSILGMTEFFANGPPRISVNRDLTGAMDDDQTALGIRGRWRATVAHEGAHVLLHRALFEVDQNQAKLFNLEERREPERLMRCLKRNVLFRGTVSDWREVQANKAMAALLMPQTVFRATAANAIERLALDSADLVAGSKVAGILATTMSEAFEVSRQAAGIRLQTLQILSPTGQRRFTQSLG
jgi:hypothetical protein